MAYVQKEVPRYFGDTEISTLNNVRDAILDNFPREELYAEGLSVDHRSPNPHLQGKIWCGREELFMSYSFRYCPSGMVVTLQQRSGELIQDQLGGLVEKLAGIIEKASEASSRRIAERLREPALR